MTGQNPKLKLSFIGEIFPNGAVPLTVVASKLMALQQAMFHAAAAAANYSEGRRGLWFNRFRPIAELTFAASHHSDLVIEAVLAADEVLHPCLDTGEKAVDILFDVASAIQQQGVIPDAVPLHQRVFLVRSLEGLMPNSGDQYTIRLENCRPNRHPAVTFTADTRQQLKGYLSISDLPDNEGETTVVGELIKIHFNAGDDKITIRVRQRDIDCFYGDALRDQIANLIAGSSVEVRGLATLNDHGDVAKIHQITNVEPVSMEPVRIARFEHEGEVFTLHSPLIVTVEYTDGLWVYNNTDLNLWGYASRREDALRELNEAFVYVYHDIAEEKKENLDVKARELHTRLLQLVKTTAGGAIHA
jgi:hypothetical protein